MEVTNPCDGSGLKTTNPITGFSARDLALRGGYFKTSVCTHCKGLRGVTWDYDIRRFKFGTHQKEGH